MNWKVRVYEGNKVIDSWIIENRTETEALHEAESEIAKESILQEKDFDWTMVKA
jgi:hypothetical protein